MTLDDRLTNYLSAREVELPNGVVHARKVLEEAGELIEALALGHHKHIMAELADVIHATALVARGEGVSLEECMDYKTELDRGRGLGRLR